MYTAHPKLAHCTTRPVRCSTHACALLHHTAPIPPPPQVTASTHGDSATMSELKRWNDQYGEGGSRQKEHFLYYT